MLDTEYTVAINTFSEPLPVTGQGEGRALGFVVGALRGVWVRVVGLAGMEIDLSAVQNAAAAADLCVNASHTHRP